MSCTSTSELMKRSVKRSERCQNNKLLLKHRSAPRFSPSLLSNLALQVDSCSNLFLFSLGSFVSNEPPLESASAITHKHTFNQTRVMQMSRSNYSDAQTLSSDLTLKNSLTNFSSCSSSVSLHRVLICGCS